MIMASIDYGDVLQRIQSSYSSCSRIEQELLKTILQEVADTGDSYTLERMWLADFKEVPVSISQFLSDPLYLGESNNHGESVYPFWKDTMNDIFAEGNKYFEILLSGATRIGKSSTAVSIMAYMLYRLMIYRNPHEYFKKKAVSRFTLAFANLTKDLASGVAFHEFQTTLKTSQWFNEHGRFTNSVSNYVYVPEGEKIDIIPASDSAHVLGMQLWACLMDEINFSRAGIKDINISKQHMKNLYNTAHARITGTFKLGGEVYGKLISSSSKNTDNDYLSEHIETQLNAGNIHMYLVDKPQWEVLPKEMFSDKTFHITVGNRYKRGFVVPKENEDELHLREYENQGFELVEVPMDFRTSFLADYDIALRDIAGISVVGAMGFITQESITPNVSETRKNPFLIDVIVSGIHDNESIERNFHTNLVDPRLKALDMRIHIDFAEVSDRIGICGVVQDGNKVVLDLETNKKVSLPYYRQVFQIGIEAPQGERMSFQKVINFILWLRKNGFHISGISTDQYQSSYVRETLNQQGFVTETISVDRSEDPYISLRNLLQDQRLELIKHQIQEDELVHLQRINGRIDHPPQSQSSTVKSVGKDCSDALCGACYAHIKHQDAPKPQAKSVARAIIGVNNRTGNKGRMPSVFNSPYRPIR